MSVHRELKGGLHYLLALSSIYCLQIVRMAILSNGIWFLVIVLIGIIPLIIQDAEHLVLWSLGLFFSFFISLKGMRKIDLWNWFHESRLCLEFISNTCHGTFPRAAVIHCPTGLLNWRCQSALAGKLFLQEMSTRWRHFFMPNWFHL